MTCVIFMPRRVAGRWGKVERDVVKTVKAASTAGKRLGFSLNPASGWTSVKGFPDHTAERQCWGFSGGHRRGETDAEVFRITPQSGNAGVFPEATAEAGRTQRISGSHRREAMQGFFRRPPQRHHKWNKPGAGPYSPPRLCGGPARSRSATRPVSAVGFRVPPGPTLQPVPSAVVNASQDIREV
jgi:hypothetical protein